MLLKKTVKKCKLQNLALRSQLSKSHCHCRRLTNLETAQAIMTFFGWILFCKICIGTQLSTNQNRLPTADVWKNNKNAKKILSNYLARALVHCQYLSRRVTKVVYTKKIVKTARVYPSDAVVVVTRGRSQTISIVVPNGFWTIFAENQQALKALL